VHPRPEAERSGVLTADRAPLHVFDVVGPRNGPLRDALVPCVGRDSLKADADMVA
jgi:hypothetical protein